MGKILSYGKMKNKTTDKAIQYGIVTSPREIGQIIRKRRKELGVHQVEAAGLSGVGVRFLSDLERGKPTCELGLAIRVATRLGLDISISPRGPKTDGKGDVA